MNLKIISMFENHIILINSELSLLIFGPEYSKPKHLYFGVFLSKTTFSTSWIIKFQRCIILKDFSNAK